MFRRFRSPSPDAGLLASGRTAPGPGSAETVPFVGYAADCRMRGSLELVHGRMADLFDGKPELRVDGVLLESLDDGHVVEVATLDLHSDELCAVVASGPRGERSRRRRTSPVPVWLDLGPYHVRGDLHALPGVDPVGWLTRRPGFAAMTNVRIHFSLNGEQSEDTVETLLVNPTHVTFVRLGG